MLHIIDEGARKHYGINFVKNKNSVLIVSFVIPFFMGRKKTYRSFDHAAYYYGRHVYCICARFRIRKWWKFKNKCKIFMSGCKIEKYHKKNRNLVYTREQYEDAHA